MKSKTAYWILTCLMAVFMLMTAVPDIMLHPEAVSMIKHLGYPTYFIPFIGTLKILGVVAVLIPGFKIVKEWAYAGLVFDLVGAFYSHLSVGDSMAMLIFPLLGLFLVGASYYYKQVNESNARKSIPKDASIAEAAN